MTDGVFAMPAATATAHVHLLKPAVPLRDLDAHAEPAIRELEDGRFHRDDHRRAPTAWTGQVSNVDGCMAARLAGPTGKNMRSAQRGSRGRSHR